MYSRLKKRFVSIDVSKPGKHLLVQQPTLHRTIPVTGGLKKLRFRDFGSIGAQPVPNRLQFLTHTATQPAESPYIAITDLFASRLKKYAYVGVRLKRQFLRCQNHLTRHAEPEEEIAGGLSVAPFKLYCQGLTLAAQTG